MRRWVAVTTARGQTARWYSPTLWQTMTFSAWVKFLRAERFSISLGKMPAAALTTAMTAGNSVLGLLQAALFSRKLAATAIHPQPIFILGHWRTGTTHLHNLLSLDERFAFPTTFECGAPHHCLLTDRLYPKLFGWLLPSRRIMDDVQLGFDHPQEDEWALVALGAPSPYWGLGFPQDSVGRRFLSLVDVGGGARKSWKGIFQDFLRLVSFRHASKPLILKSPAHTARLSMIAEMFPEGRFLHIVREPCTVFASTVRLWRELRAVNALAPWNDDELEREVLETLPELYKTFDAVRATLRPGRFHQVRYEDLVRDPIATLDGCYRELELGEFAVARPQVERYLAGLGNYRTNEYSVSPEGQAAIRASWGPLFREWGYES